MGTYKSKKPWLTKEINTRSLNGYKKAVKNQFKQGDNYYLKDPWKDSISKRMDWDTTRGKFSFDKIINSFAKQEIDILIGTQMITKGLDFKNIGLVGVINTDHFLNFPDFRAHEKAFQTLTQVAGRSGRSGDRGKVLMQTYQPEHPIIKNVIENDYEKMYQNMFKDNDFNWSKLVQTGLEQELLNLYKPKDREKHENERNKRLIELLIHKASKVK